MELLLGRSSAAREGLPPIRIGPQASAASDYHSEHVENARLELPRTPALPTWSAEPPLSNFRPG